MVIFFITLFSGIPALFLALQAASLKDFTRSQTSSLLHRDFAQSFTEVFLQL